METSGYHHSIAEDYSEVYQRLPFKLVLAYGVGHVLNDICASMWFTYLLVFFNLVLQFDSQQSGIVLLIGQIADAIGTLFVGFQSDLVDNFWMCRYGRRKTWHLFGSIFVLGAFPFIFSSCVSCATSPKSDQLFYFSVFVVIFQFGWASIQISHLSLIPELTPNEHDRTRLTAIRYSFTVFSNVLVYVIAWAVLHVNEGNTDTQIGPNDLKKFETIVWYGLGVGIFCTIIFHILVKEDHRGSSDIRGSEVRSGIRDLLCNIEVYQVAGVYMSTRLFVNLSQVFIPLYLHNTLNMVAQALALVPLTMFLSSFVTSFVIEFLNRRLGRKLAYMLGTILGILACVWIQLRSGSDFKKYDVYGVGILFGASGSVILITSLGITADLIGTNTRNGAFIYGVMSFTDKLANGIAVIVIQHISDQSAIVTYYRNVLSFVCGGSIIIGTLFVLSLIRNYRDISGYSVITTSRNAEQSTPPSTVINSVQEDIQPALIS